MTLSSSGSLLSSVIQTLTLYLILHSTVPSITKLIYSIDLFTLFIFYFLLIFILFDSWSFRFIISVFSFYQLMLHYRRKACSNLTAIFRTFFQKLTFIDFLTIIIEFFIIVHVFYDTIHSTNLISLSFLLTFSFAIQPVSIFLPLIITISTFCFTMNCLNFSHRPFNSIFSCSNPWDVSANSLIWIS